MKKVAFLCGPYKGDIERNIAEAREAAQQLWRAGYCVICPHTNSAHFDPELEEHFISGYLQLLRRCDLLVAMPKWVSSSGARGEVAVAITLEIPVLTLEEALGAQSQI
jgi:hypothetical protein